MLLISNFTNIVNHIGEIIVLHGYVQNIRVLKNCIFIIIRRNHILLQCILKQKLQDDISIESTIKITGIVQCRNANNINLKDKLGKYEIIISEYTITNRCKELPFPILHATKNSIEHRERYRFLDLRDNISFEYLMIRIKTIKFMRHYFDNLNFLEINTPILTALTDNGAGNYTVNSKNHINKLYALSQSPQVYKQILMCSDIEKYYQISTCFRDEESRSNRLCTEFTQVDMEMKVDNVTEMLDLLIDLVTKTLIMLKPKSTYSIKIMKYDEIINLYGTDQIDMRTWEKFDIQFHDDYIKFQNLNNVYTDMKTQFPELCLQNNYCFIQNNSNNKNAVLMHLSLLFNREYNDEQHHSIVVVTDYPFFEYDENNEPAFRHNPFSKTYMLNDIVYSYQYDLILDGQEIAGGSIRENNSEQIAKFIKDKALTNFIDMYNYSCIMHGGFAIGLERMLSIIFNADIINFVPFFTRKNGNSALVISPN